MWSRPSSSILSEVRVVLAEDLIKAGDVEGALAALQDQIRKSPDDARLRIFLFQLLCVQGNWKRAIVQLKTAATLDPDAATMAQMYREAIICEVFRDKVFLGEAAPLIFGEPDEWMAWMIQALKRQIAGDQPAANDLRAQAFDAAPAVKGTLNGVPFDWIADADPRLGPILEVIIDGKYYWAPFSAIHRIVFEPPADLRDAVWTPGTITWSNGGEVVGLIPTRYAGSAQSTQPVHQLARTTDWATDGDDVKEGLGQRMWVTDTHDYALMDVRELVLGELLDIAVPDHG